MATLKLSTGPTEEPVSEHELSNQILVDVTDPMLGSYISAARVYVENLTGPLITQTWIQYEDDWPADDYLYIRMPRLVSVTSVKYKDENAVESTFSSSYYNVNTQDEYRPCISLKPLYSWPVSTTLYAVNPIYVTFVCGFGAASSVPLPIRQAIMMLAGYLYENREADAKGFPNSVLDALLANYRFRG